jgi:serine/threonine-protein kinase
MATTPQQPLPFKRLGEYDVLAPISEGGMASVWLARPRHAPERVVAIKVIKPEHARNKEFVAMFLDEAGIASHLKHPNIIQLHELGSDGKRPFLVMEVLRGRTLLEVWTAAHEQGRCLGYPLVAWIGARVADALHHAHEMRDDGGALREIVHRDVNPSNLFLTHEGVPKLIDFGLAKARDRVASTAFGVLKGKLAYLAPEQVHGKPADRRSDVFALGVTLWELSLDRRLFRQDSDVETVRRVRDADVPDPTTLVEGYPPALAATLRRALERDPEKRWATAAEFRDALDAYVATSATEIGPEGVRAVLAALFSDAPPAPWERLVDEAAVGEARIRVWDDDRQKLTWMNAAIETLAPATARSPAAPFPANHASRLARLDAALAEHLAAIDDKSDPIGSSRAHLERALVQEMLGEPTRAAAYAEESNRVSPSPAAHAMLRRLGHAPGAAAALLPHLDAEIAELPSGRTRAALLSERARLVAASRGPRAETRAAWERAVDADPTYPAALRGLEGALRADPGATSDLASHLARMADAFVDQPRLAAWLHVERARNLDALDQPDAAKAALVRALDLDPGLGPVRAAGVAHAAGHPDAAWAVLLLAEEARLEPDPARAASLELNAAVHARHRLGDRDAALGLLTLAAARTPIAPILHRHILDEMVALHEAAGRHLDLLRVRRLRLPLVEDARARAQEHRAIAGLEEATGNVVAAIVSLDQALELAPDDATIAHDLDRLLATAGLAARRVELWSRIAATTPPGPSRARHLLHAATIAHAGGDATRAVELARTALVADPASVEATDRLLHLLSPSPDPAAAAAAQARIAVHAHASEHAPDAARRVSHLEAIAAIQEEVLLDPALATSTYETILRLDERRRSAIVGLARTAARAGDRLRASRALLAEAANVTDPAVADGLRVRAAEMLPPLESDRALSIVRDVLARKPTHEAARRVEQRIHEEAGRWARVDECLQGRIEQATDRRARIDLWLARAEIQRSRLRAPREALGSLRQALALDAAHPGAREALIGLLEALGDSTALRDGLLELAAGASSAPERVTLLTRAAEIDELVLLDDAHATESYARALVDAPDDDTLVERHLRVLTRRARTSRDGAARELEDALERRLARSPACTARTFALALARIDAGHFDAAATLVESVLLAEPTAAHALRTLELIGRATDQASRIARACALQGAAFGSSASAVGALWVEADLAAWTLQDGDEGLPVMRILRTTPDDRAALDAAVRLALPAARGGDLDARARMVSALRARLTGATESERRWTHLAIALALEPEDAPLDQSATREALASYREVQRLDLRSVVAAAGAARLGAALADGEAVVAAALAHAELAADPRRRAIFLVHAAGQTLASSDARLGARAVRLGRAGEMVERALDADPEALPAIGLLVAVRTEEGTPPAVLLAPLRQAFDRATSPDAVILLGGEIARIASIEPADRLLAIAALRRVLEMRPDHAPTLRALADQHLAQQAWGDAVEALERLAGAERDPRARLAALFELAELHTTRLARPSDAEHALRAALDIDPSSSEALRRLLALRRGDAPPAAETIGLLERLADAETAPDARAAALTELARARRSAGDDDGARSALVNATALAPTPERIAALLELNAGAPADQIRSFEAVVARAREADRADPVSLATLGRLEIDAGHWREGIEHLHVALGLAPGMHEARAALARGLARMRGGAEAAGLILPMVVPDPRPLLSLDDPAGALATLEAALSEEGRTDEAIVARELRAVAGALDDGSHAALRARRLAVDPSAPIPTVLDTPTMRSAVFPPDGPGLLLDVALALAGIEGKLTHVALEDVGASPRSRLVHGTSGQPVLAIVARLAALLGLERPEVVVGADVQHPRPLVHDGFWLVIPEALVAQPEPVQAASIMGPLVRLALRVAWLDDLPGAYAHALLCAAIRQVIPGYASEVGGGEQQDLIDEMSRRVGKAVGRKQKKALHELVPALEAARTATRADAEAFERAIESCELHAAFVAGGDLLATLDVLRALDVGLGKATEAVGISALGAVMTHPLAGDLARFALAPSTTTLRRRAGSSWAPPHGVWRAP